MYEIELLSGQLLAITVVLRCATMIIQDTGFVLIRNRYKYALFARVFSLQFWRFSNISDRNLRPLSRPPARFEIRISRHLAKADTNCLIGATAAGLWLLCDVLVTVPLLLLPEKSVKMCFYAPMPFCARRLVVSIRYEEKIHYSNSWELITLEW